MLNEGEMTQDNAVESAGSTNEVGEAQASENVGGESVQTASDEKGTAGEGLFDGMKPEDLHKSYKSLQGEYSKVKGVMKQFESFGGPDQIMQWADYLSKNPRFTEWIQKEQGRNTMGVDESEMDESTKQAYQAVRHIAENIADAKTRQLLQQEIAPLSNAYKEQLLDRHFTDMDKKYGKDWHEVRDKMSELSESLSGKIQDRPQFSDIEDLYFKALRETGKFDSYAAKQYERKLTEKKAHATDKPRPAGDSAPKPARTIQEAFEAAKRLHSVT